MIELCEVKKRFPPPEALVSLDEKDVVFVSDACEEEGKEDELVGGWLEE